MRKCIRRTAYNDQGRARRRCVKGVQDWKIGGLEEMDCRPASEFSLLNTQLMPLVGFPLQPNSLVCPVA